jgi:hypothetical protein
MELKPITISFKNTPDEMALYEIISKHSSKGAFIKDTLIEALLKKGLPKDKDEMQIKSSNNVDELNEILDI